MPERNGTGPNGDGSRKLPPLKDGTQSGGPSSPGRSYKVKVSLDCLTGECDLVYDISPSEEPLEEDEQVVMDHTPDTEPTDDDLPGTGEGFLRVV